MSKSQEELLGYLQQYGGTADLLGLDDDVKIFWQLPVRYLVDALDPARASEEEPDKEFPVYVALVENGGFNAVIRHEQEAVVGGIFIGVPLVALKACRLLALRLDMQTALPICDDEGRVIRFPDKIKLPTRWAVGASPKMQALDDFLEFESTTSTHNNELALLMFDIMMRYVAMHECMHFALGHARYCQRALGMSFFEDGAERRSELPGYLSQVLEFIADRHVIMGLAEDLTSGRLYHEWSRELPASIEMEPARWYRRILLVTMSLISRLWTVHGSQRFGDLSQPYPHPYERLCWMLTTLREIEGDDLAGDGMLALGSTMATLDHNYSTAYQLGPVLGQDERLRELTGKSLLDEGYAVIRHEAKRLQTQLFHKYAPYYPAGS